MPVIDVNHLVKQYGRIEALRGVTLAVEPGQIFGLLGQNGAGKTTLIKVLLGIVRPSFGDAHLLGHPAGTVAVRRQVGYLPEDHRFPDYHTAHTLLDYYGALLSVPRRERLGRADEMLELVGLSSRRHSRAIGDSSRNLPAFMEKRQKWCNVRFVQKDCKDLADGVARKSEASPGRRGGHGGVGPGGPPYETSGGEKPHRPSSSRRGGPLLPADRQ